MKDWNIMHVAAILWLVIAGVALASPGLKMHVPPFDPVVYSLVDQTTGDPLTWAQCEDVVAFYHAKIIADKDMFLASSIETGDFIIKCVELDEYGEEIPDEDEVSTD